MPNARAFPWRLTPALGLTAFALVLNGCANKTPSTPGSASGGAGGSAIVVGEFGSMTGDKATFGTSTDNGIKLAVAQINKDGGIDGHPLDVHLQDDEGKPDEALTVVKKLITEDKAVAILGEVASKNSIAAAPFCNSSKVPMISPSSTNPKVTLDKPYVFRVCFIDPFQGKVAAEFATGKLKAKTAAIMRDATGDYSIGLTQAFQDNFTKMGGRIVALKDYQAGDPDFRAQLVAIKAANPDILYIPGYYNEVGTIARQAREVGLTKTPLLGGDGWESDKLIEGAGGPGGALENCYFTDHSSLDVSDPLTKKFADGYQAAYNQPASALAAEGYDAALVLADAMKRAGKPADGDYDSEAYRAKLRDAIAATKGFKGATGDITLDADRNANKPAVVLQIKGKAFNLVDTYQP